jgi:hypothetical protein
MKGLNVVQMKELFENHLFQCYQGYAPKPAELMSVKTYCVPLSFTETTKMEQIAQKLELFGLNSKQISVFKDLLEDKYNNNWIKDIRNIFCAYQ